MTQSGRFPLGLILAFVAGGVLGSAAGGYFGFSRGMSSILNDVVYADARKVQTLLDALKAIRAKKAADAAELLEAHIDDQLVMFDPMQPYPLESRAAAEVDKAIGAAKAYRSAYPRKSRRSGVDAMVANLLNRSPRHE